MEVNGAAELLVVQGPREHLTVETPTRGQRIVANVRGDTLAITIRDTRRWWQALTGRGSGSRTTRITVTVRAIDALALNGAVKMTGTGLTTPALRLSASGGSSVQIDGLKTGTLRVSGNGALKARLSGEATEQHVSISGAGEYQAEELASERATINVSGVGHVVVRVERELNATISGAGNVEYVGSPVVKERVSGMGRVKRLESRGTAARRQDGGVAARRRVRAVRGDLKPSRAQCTARPGASGLQKRSRPVPASRSGCSAGDDPHVRHAAVAQQLDHRGDDVRHALVGRERAAKALRVARSERRRQRQPQLAAARRVGRLVRADHRGRLAERRPQPAQRVAREELQRDLALRGTSGRRAPARAAAARAAARAP